MKHIKRFNFNNKFFIDTKIKRFNEVWNWSDENRVLSDDEIEDEIQRIAQIKDTILDIFQPLKDKFSDSVVSVNSGSGGKFNHIAIEVISKDTLNGFDDDEKEVLKYILKHFENWCNDVENNFEIVDESEEDCSYIELVEAEIICPECGEYEINTGGYDEYSGKSWSECTNTKCEYTADDSEFEEKFLNFYDFEKLNKILFEPNPNRVQYLVSFDIVIRV